MDSNPWIGIIDYGMGNIQSVLNAFEYLGKDARPVRTAEEIAGAERIVLPGVGAFGVGMENLRAQGLVEALQHGVVERRKPFLGICLGMQLICRESFEFGHFQGLGWIDAAVRRFEPDLGIRIPHVGWNNLIIKRRSALLESREDGPDAYFVHSYYVDAEEPCDVAATCLYGREFAALLEKGNIFAAQFHPEKSQEAGLRMLARFAEVSRPC
jgi:glutamine amidotransferase